MNDPKKLASKGRYGDTMLAHINPEEAALLKARGGSGTINPKTGLPEFYGDGGAYYKQQNQATLAAQQAAEKAAAKKAAGPAPAPALTPEQRQANIARDLALSQIRGARPSGQDSQFYQPAYQSQYTNYATTNPLDASQYGTPMTARSLVDSAYAGIGRYGSGNQTNQVDPGGRQYWENRLASGSLNPQSLFDQFSGAVNQARQTPGDRYGQYYQNQTGYGGGYQGYMPQMQSPFSYQQPAQQMNWQTGQPTQSGNTLTPELARTLMQRSMTSSGVPTSEFQKFGGYDTVKALYDKSGGDYSGQGNPYPQQQFNPYTNQYQTPFSYQQPQQPMQQMQTPFSYQQPMQQMQQPMAQTNYGPSQAIVGRSSQMRGTPSVMRRAEGGITSLLKKDE